MKKPPLLLLLMTLCLAGVAQYSPRLLALTQAAIIDSNHRSPLINQTVLIANGRIKDIFPSGSRPIPDSAVVINLNEKFVLPGLIDSHVHMATDPSDVDRRDRTLDVLNRMLYSGVTTVRDMAGDGRVLAGLAREAQLSEIVSPDIYYSALMAGPEFFADPRTATSTRGGADGNMPYMQAVTDTTNLVLAVARAIGSGASGIKLYANLSSQLVKKIVAEANRQNIIVYGHAWLQQAIPSDLVNAGVVSISHAPLMVHEMQREIPARWKQELKDSKFWDDSLPDLTKLFISMRTHHTILDATLLTYKKWAETDTAMRWDYEIGKRITARAYRAGVTICAGTDDDQVQFVQAEMKVLVTDAGLSPIDAIDAATINGARVLRLQQDRGTVEVGKKADLLVLDKNPLITIDNINAVNMVVKDGGIYKK
jgi:imidazolonepropionase-like amidohydrolase